MTYIKVIIDQEKGVISVENDGKGIPVQEHKEHKVFIPELIFGHLLTSSNYDDNEKKVTGGRNGYGAKLTNIYSKEFMIETLDKENKLYYKQEFRSNMKEIGKAKIEKSEKKSFTRITFTPDLRLFKINSITNDMYALLSKRVYDLAGVTSSKVHVYLNEKQLKVKSFSDYIKFFVEEEAEVFFTHPHEYWEIGFCLSDGFDQVSFVNSICTSKGGNHVSYVTDKLVSHIAEIMKKKNKNLEIKPQQIRQHMKIFINCKIINPTFESQTKESMSSKVSNFGSSFDFDDAFLKKVEKCGIVTNCLEYAKARENIKLKNNLNQNVKKNTRIVGIPKLDDANFAGKKNSIECTLILTEGDSAKNLAIAGFEILGRDYFGVFPLRGKLLNVRDASAKSISNNEEIQALLKIIGLKLGTNYTNRNDLRYGSIMIMTDQDHDGSHIKGLIINFFHYYWPGLVKIQGFLQEFITPILKAQKGKEILSFYSIPEYKEWVVNSGGDEATKAWEVKYYKGLGTSTNKEAKEYFSDLKKHKILFKYQDDGDDESIDMAFNKTKAEERKNWLALYNPEEEAIPEEDGLRYTEFINKQLIHFSNSDNIRSIPSLCDGLKPSERKIVYCCFKKKQNAEIKVNQLAGYIAEHSNYHHGEMSLFSTIVALAQNFVGSNNINLLYPSGQYGSRNLGGKDHASPRYIFTRLSKITRKIFHPDDDQLLNYIYEEGDKIEPTFYVPILPMILVNGADGIGTGWATSVPCFNPREIVASLKNKLLKGDFLDIHPYYKGYEGEIIKKETGYATYGKYELIDDDHQRNVCITELPIKKWTKDYRVHLDKLCGVDNDDDKDKKKKDDKDDKSQNGGASAIILEFYDEYSTTTKARFKAKVVDSEKQKLIGDHDKMIKVFKLASSIPTSNMVLFDRKGKIRKYDTVNEIMADFFEVRIEYYERRKFQMIKNFEKDLLLISNKCRFILEVISGDIILHKTKKSIIVANLIDRKYSRISEINKINRINPSFVYEVEGSNEVVEVERNNSEFNYLLNMPILSLSEEKLEELLKQKDDCTQKLEVMKETSIISLWERDLDEFLIAYDEFENEDLLEAEKLDGVDKKKGKHPPKAKGKGEKGKEKLNKSDASIDKGLNRSIDEVNKKVKKQVDNNKNEINAKPVISVVNALKPKQANEKAIPVVKPSDEVKPKTEYTQEELSQMPLIERLKLRQKMNSINNNDIQASKPDLRKLNKALKRDAPAFNIEEAFEDAFGEYVSNYKRVPSFNPPSSNQEYNNVQRRIIRDSDSE